MHHTLAPARRSAPATRIIGRTLGAVLLSLTLACGDDDDGSPTAPVTGNSSLSASVNGTTFSPIAVQGAYSNGVVVITGTGTTGSITIGVNNAAAGAGTYQLGPTTANAATFSAVTGAATTGTWASNATGGSGSVTFSTLTTTRAVGTFTFTGAAVAGTGATGTRAVTNGTFDIRLATAP